MPAPTLLMHEGRPWHDHPQPYPQHRPAHPQALQHRRPPAPPPPVRATTRPGLSVLTVEEIAKELRVSKMTVLRAIHRGELKAFRVGRSFRIPEREFGRYLRNAFDLDQFEDEA